MAKKSFLPSFLILLGLVTVAAGGSYLYLRGQLPWQKFTPLESAKVIPRSAVAASFVSTDPKAWSVLAKYGTPDSRNVISQGINELEKSLATNKINYEKDIQPWIGGVTLAFLPKAKAGESGMLIVVGIKDKIKAMEFAKKMQQRPTTESDYKGVKITEMKTNQGKTYTATTGDYLLVAENRAAIEAAIDTYQGQPSYSNKPEVKQLLSQSLTLKNPLAQVYIDDYAALVTAGANLPAETAQQLKKIQGIVAGVGSVEGGLHFQAVAKLDPTTVSTLPPNANSNILNNFPTETIALWSGNNLKQGWTEFDRQSQTDPSLQEVARQIRQTLRTASLDADKEVFGWMDREFAFGVIPSSQAMGNLGFGGLMIWETGDRKTAETTLDKLNQLVKSSAPMITIETNPQVTEWKAQGQTVLSYGWIDPDSLAMTIAIPPQSKPTTPLTQNPTFQASTASLPKNNLGYVYIDVEQIIAKSGGLANIPATQLNPESKAFLESLKGVTMTVTMRDKTTSQMDVLFSLKEVP